MRQRLYAIRKFHRLLRLPDLTNDEDISLALRRVLRSKAVRPKQTSAPPAAIRGDNPNR